MRLLVTGAGGMLGRDVVAAAERSGHTVTALTRAELDVTDAAAARAAVRGHDAVVNCAAWTDVDGAEAAEEEATRVNGEGAGNVAAGAGFVVHVSSDYVFDGRATTPYDEDDPPAPQSAYGRSKLAGELAVREGAPGRHAIVRSSWLFGPHGRNFVDTMLTLAREREEVTVVDDQVGCPTFTGHLAPALVEIAERRPTGILHVAGGGSCSWYDLAVAAFEEAGETCSVRRGRTEDLGRPAPRPRFSALGCSRPDAPALPHWREGLRAHLNERITT